MELYKSHIKYKKFVSKNLQSLEDSVNTWVEESSSNPGFSVYKLVGDQFTVGSTVYHVVHVTYSIELPVVNDWFEDYVTIDGLLNEGTLDFDEEESIESVPIVEDFNIGKSLGDELNVLGGLLDGEVEEVVEVDDFSELDFELDKEKEESAKKFLERLRGAE